MKKKTRWYLCVPTALACLFAVDVALGFWQPSPMRLPEQFSGAYLKRLVAIDGRSPAPIVFLGDSVVWGYRLPPTAAASSLLATAFPRRTILNLSYEGGSSANTYFMLRYLLASGIRPSLIVFNVNSKQANPEDSAYRRLQPSLEVNVEPLFDAGDRRRLDMLPAPTLASRLESGVAAIWALYRYRTDLREALFGTDDASGAFRNAVQHFTGSEALQAAQHRPTAEKFMGTYDLLPLKPDNVDFFYLKKLGALLERERIPAIAFLTPTNHQLLHDYIDGPGYSAQLDQMSSALRRSSVRVLDFDRALPTSQFLDNEHLTVSGNRRLADMLRATMREVLTK